MLRGKSIFVIGPEGSGKTTQIKLIHYWLKERGRKTLVTGFADSHLLAYIIRRVLILLGRRVVYYLPGNRLYIGLDSNIIRRILSVYSRLAFISALVIYLFKVKVANAFGYIVVSERHPIHAVVNVYSIAKFHRLHIKKHSLLINVLFRLLRDNCILILLDVPYGVLLERYKSRGSNIEPPWYVQIQRRFINYIARNYDSLLIDTSRHDVINSFHKIRRYVSERLVSK